jgi:hypothetical protein
MTFPSLLLDGITHLAAFLCNPLTKLRQILTIAGSARILPFSRNLAVSLGEYLRRRLPVVPDGHNILREMFSGGENEFRLQQ